MPRSLEDEGFYVGTPPQVDQSRLCIMENRLLLSDQEVHMLAEGLNRCKT